MWAGCIFSVIMYIYIVQGFIDILTNSLSGAETLAVLVKSKIIENTEFGIVTYILFLS